MMENLWGFAALKRSKNLVKRSFRTASATILMMFLVPVLTSLFITFFAKSVVREFTPEPDKPSVSRVSSENSGDRTTANGAEDENVTISLGPNKSVVIQEGKNQPDENKMLRYAFREALTQIIYLPISILLVSFFTIVIALLYSKTRQIGGESMQDLLMKFEESDRQRSNWQKRIRQRIEQSGKQTSRS